MADIGELGLAILEHFVAGTLGDKFVSNLRQPFDQRIAISQALQETGNRLRKEWDDKRLYMALFEHLPKNKQLLIDLRQAVERFCKHPTDTGFSDVLKKILQEQEEIPTDEIEPAVAMYIHVLTEELAMADETFRDKAVALADLRTGMAGPQPLSALDHRTEAWLVAHLDDVSKKFARHMTASQLKPGVHPEELYLDLLVTERDQGKREEASSENRKTAKESCLLQDVLQQTQTPLLLIGEGGSGKTTSLLYAAARAADRAKADQAAPIPIYVDLARLTKMEGTPDLLQRIADSVPIVSDWKELSDLEVTEHRRILFIFDSFNEIPEQLQRTCRVALQSFVEKQGDRHIYLIGSRPIPLVEQLAFPPSNFKTFEILRLTSDQVQGFLQDLGLGSLYDRMPRELRDLAGNPFMLLAIARTLAGEPEIDLPRNQGKLYQGFAHGWMENEEKKRNLEYSYERVKEPLLMSLATHMTSAGQTSLVWINELEDEIETHLEEIHKHIQGRGGIPINPTLDNCLTEIFGDGLLKRLNEQIYFIHQSVQEYYTGLSFKDLPDALVDFTPKLLWEFVPTYELAKVPNHRFVQPLLMMAGLLDDSTKIVEALAARNPILAAAAISSANRVDGSLLAQLEQSWLDLLNNDDLRHRIVACSCLTLASMRSPRVVERMVAFALSTDNDNSWAGSLALQELDAPDAITNELAKQVLSLQDDEYSEKRFDIGNLVEKLQSKRMVDILFEQWRGSPPDSSTRHRFEGLLAAMDKSLVSEELQRIRTSAVDPTITADAERALAEAPSWDGVGRITSAFELRKLMAQAQSQYKDRLAEAIVKVRSMDNEELTACLRSNDPAVGAAAATLAAERHVPVGDAIFESIVRSDHGWSEKDLISALVSLWGEHTTVSKFVERSREKCYCIGTLTPELAAQLTVGELSEAVKTEIERLGLESEDLSIDSNEIHNSTSFWNLLPSSWSSYRPLYQLRASPGRLEFYDCNVAARAFSAIAQIPGEDSLAELRLAVDHNDSNVQKIAINTLVERGDPSLTAKLLRKLHSATSVDFIEVALEALGDLHNREALSLMNDLLIITEGDFSDIHPVWGWCPEDPGWGDAIHRTLVNLNADRDIQQALDKALAMGDPVNKAAAAKEFSRWFAESDLGSEREATWRTPEYLQQLLSAALRDSTQTVRTAAAGALGKLMSEDVKRLLADALTDTAVEVQVAAGEALVQIEAKELYGRVADSMLQVAKTNQAQDLRRRAGKVLSAIPGGVEPFYQPIQAELLREKYESALEMVKATLEILPEDVNLFWWRGHALRNLGRLDEAADSYQRASELEKHASVVPQALAQTFLELGKFPQAMETAKRGVEIDPSDADAQSILAWSCYKADAIPEAVEVAIKAVDLDPVHSDAIWIVLLGKIRQADLGESRSAFQYALRVRQLLSPGLDTSFVADFLKELGNIHAENSAISQLIEEIKNAFVSEGSKPN